MHLVVPFAATLSEAGAAAMRELRLPHLQRVLSLLEAADTVGSDETSLNLPHEHWLARHRGWPAEDGRLPFAAHLARADGLAPMAGEGGWGLLTPSHWQAGSERIVLQDPQALALDAAESRALLDAVRPLFDDSGWTLHWGAPLRWYAVHPSLATLATASLDRVIGRAIDPWLPGRRAAAAVRRLQAEAQMLLHDHPLNAQREARGALAVNSFWLSGTGAMPPGVTHGDEPRLDLRLRGPLLAEDWTAWREDWQTLDGEVLADLVAACARGEPSSLVLAGECRAQRFVLRSRGLVERFAARWRSPGCSMLLESL